MSDLILIELAKRGLRRHNPVGKLIGGSLYCHRDYADLVVPAKVLKLGEGFVYNCVKYSKKAGTISFQFSGDFDTSPEPEMSHYRLVTLSTGDMKEIRIANPPVWHHKWMWVQADYSGFDVTESMLRSLAIALYSPEEKRRMGNRQIWNDLKKAKGLG